MFPHLLGLRGPGRYIPLSGGGGGEGDPGSEEPPVVITTATGDVTINGKIKPGSFGKIIVPLAAVAANRRYTFRAVANFSRLAQQGKLAMVGAGFKNGNDFHITGLRGDGSSGVDEYIVHGTAPNGWNKLTGHTEVNGGDAASGTQHSAYYRLTISADGTTYDLDTGTDGVAWTSVAAAQALTPFTNVSGVTTFGVALWFNNADAGPYSVAVSQFADVAAPVYPLDGTTPTGAWSLSRALRSAYGGAFYTIDTGIDRIYDQSGNAYDFTNATDASQPALVTAGPNSRAAADFSSDALFGTTSSNLINVGDHYMIMSLLVDAVNLNSATLSTNDIVLGFPGTTTPRKGIMLRNSGTPKRIYGLCNGGAGNLGAARDEVTLGTALVVEYRQEGGTLYCRVNGGTETSQAAGDSFALNTNGCWIGGRGASDQFFDGKIFEFATFKTIPNSGARDALVADMKAWVGI